MSELVCIVCPRDCTMQLEKDGDKIKVTGNFCKRGEQFAVSETVKPMRTICSTVRTAFPDVPVIPVRVSADIPKDRVFEVMQEINSVTLTQRIGRGEVVIENVLGLGVDVVATSGKLKEQKYTAPHTKELQMA